MAWEFSKDIPIYLQIIQQIQMKILSGEYKSGDKLLPVRELAAEAAVNPNTMQKALQQLEREGVIFSQRTSGRFITEDKSKIGKLKEDFIKEEIFEISEKMKNIGLTKEEFINYIEKNIW